MLPAAAPGLLVEQHGHKLFVVDVAVAVDVGFLNEFFALLCDGKMQESCDLGYNLL
jgi:hypothetical protein